MAEIDVSNRIAQQIENTADYYPPATYSGSGTSYEPTPLSYLTFYNEMVLSADHLADQFIPLSAVPGKGRNPKLFAIGVIPPSANITGRILDRSASVAQIVPPIYDRKAGQAAPLPPLQDLKPLSVAQKNKLFGEFSYVPNPTTNNPEGITVTDDWAAKNLITVEIPQLKGIPGYHDNGKIKLHKAVAGQFQSFFASVESSGLLSQILTFGGSYNSRFVRGSNSTLSPHAWGTAIDINAAWNGFGVKPAAEGAKGSTLPFVSIASSVGLTWGGKFSKPDGMHFEAAAIMDVPAPDLLPPQPEQPAAPWDGSAAADAREMQEKTANSPLTAEDIAKRYTAAQTAQIKIIQGALDAMRNTPPLRLMVNPQSFSVKGEKIVSDGGWSRNGATIIEHWGNAQEKISASGKVAGFYAVDVLNGTGPGLTRMARNASQSWQNFQSLQLFYANNGGLHTLDPTTANLERNLSMVGSIYIYYDSILYIGSFDSFTVSESDTAPHTVDYSFEFTVRAAFILDNPNPNDLGSYGAAQQAGAKPVTSALQR